MVLRQASRARHVRKSGIGGAATWCYIGRFVRDSFRQACNTSPPKGVDARRAFPRRTQAVGTSRIRAVLASLVPGTHKGVKPSSDISMQQK